ncbi:MAG: hypothetical protein U0168_23035 [Nannocystaceae bacterium]
MPHRLRLASALACVAVAASACSETPMSTFRALPQLREAFAPLGLEVEAMPDGVAALQWQAPSATCPWVMQLDVAYTPAQAYEQDSRSMLAIARDDDRLALVDGAPIPAGVAAKLSLFYQGLRAEKRGQLREAWASGEFFGPAAPTAGCMPRTWDPMEDALALAWPRLPGRVVAVDESWEGLRVDGKCNRSPCVDPTTGGGGPDNHHRACVGMAWRERLAGVFEIADGRFALVESHWDDGHAGQGIQTERQTLISLEHGRPVWSRTVVDHRFPQPAADHSFAPVVRTWTMHTLDGCGGSLTTLGLTLDASQTEQRAQVLDRLAHPDPKLVERPQPPPSEAPVFPTPPPPQ